MKGTFCLSFVLCYMMVAARQSASRQVGGSFQNPFDPIWVEKLQLAIENVDETLAATDPPEYAYSPIGGIYEVDTTQMIDGAVEYHMRYNTPGGWFSYGTDCAIDFTIFYTRTDPTWRDVAVQTLNCYPSGNN